MDYTETTEWLFTQLPMYQRQGKSAYKADLENSLALDFRFGHPHKLYSTIHVAGTNGKGSVSHMIASILQQSGLKTGLYTSPHLKDFRERIKINGKEIPKEYVSKFVSDNKEYFEKIQPSFFEMTSTMAFTWFAQEHIDIAVIEVGLGGRLDSTNVITPILSVITNISLDHTAILGNTLEKIATEKAGIIKKGVPVVIGKKDLAYDFVFANKANECHSAITFASEEWDIKQVSEGIFNASRSSDVSLNDLQCELKGEYQTENIATVLEAIHTLRTSGMQLTEHDVRNGIAKVVTNTKLLGRWQKLSDAPYTICDTGHNPDGFRHIVKQLATCKYKYKTQHIVIGMVSDKDVDGVLSMLPKDAKYYFCKASIPRAMSEVLLKEKAESAGLKGDCYPTVAEALAAAKGKATENDMIYIGGSTFVVAEVI